MAHVLSGFASSFAGAENNRVFDFRSDIAADYSSTIEKFRSPPSAAEFFHNSDSHASAPPMEVVRQRLEA